jgi:RNA polymerase sigma-70 factor (ECF subfamily)
VDCTALDDESLMGLILDAEPEALGELYNRYGHLVFSLAFQTVGEPAAAEEITQDVFVRVWQRAEQYRPEQGKVRSWLATIARHRAIDHLRRRGVQPELRAVAWADESSEPGSTIDGLQQEAELDMQREQVHAAVSQLPREQEQVLVLAYFQGLSQSQIAAALDLPLGTVKTRIRLGMDKLRQMLRDESADDQDSRTG